jgi:hypothetical protein
VYSFASSPRRAAESTNTSDAAPRPRPHQFSILHAVTHTSLRRLHAGSLVAYHLAVRQVAHSLHDVVPAGDVLVRRTPGSSAFIPQFGLWFTTVLHPARATRWSRHQPHDRYACAHTWRGPAGLSGSIDHCLSAFPYVHESSAPVPRHLLAGVAQKYHNGLRYSYSPYRKMASLQARDAVRLPENRLFDTAASRPTEKA